MSPSWLLVHGDEPLSSFLPSVFLILWGTMCALVWSQCSYCDLIHICSCPLPLPCPALSHHPSSCEVVWSCIAVVTRLCPAVHAVLCRALPCHAELAVPCHAMLRPGMSCCALLSLLCPVRHCGALLSLMWPHLALPALLCPAIPFKPCTALPMFSHIHMPDSQAWVYTHSDTGRLSESTTQHSKAASPLLQLAKSAFTSR